MTIVRTAEMSECGLYRYGLTRVWSYSKPLLPFIMLNPSIADGLIDDPTIRRCMRFSQDFGFGGIAVGNLYAFRTPYQERLKEVQDPYGPNNEAALRAIARKAAAARVNVVCAWGKTNVSNSFLHLMAAEGATLKCLGFTQEGYPRHPLYVKATQQLMDYPAPISTR